MRNDYALEKILLAILTGIGLVVGYMVYYNSSQETVYATVTHKERVIQGESSYYLVFTSKETFKNTDSLLFKKFNSSDIYGSIEVGKDYKFDVAGWRIPFLSTYRNIIQVESAKT